MGVVCYVHMLIVVFLSIHTVPYIIYVHSLIVVSLIAFFLSMHLVYMLTCRLSFSYIYTSRILYSHLLIVVFLLMRTRMHMRTRWLSFPINASRMYMLKRWLYYIYIFFQYPSIDIDKWTCMHAKRNVLVMIRRIGGVSSCLCCANDRDRRARWYQDLSNRDIAHK